MSKKMQYCFNCGKELGIYEKSYGEIDTCGERECERAAREYQAEVDADAEDRAERDHYVRYRL